MNDENNMVILNENGETPEISETETIVTITEDNILDNEIDILQNLFGEEDIDFGLKSVTDLLALEENHFQALSESFLAKFQNNLKENKEVFTLLAKENNYKLEEFQEAFLEIQEGINSSNELSQSKKDFLIRLIAIIFDAFFEDAEGKKIVSIPCKLEEGIKIPTYAHETDAGLDIYAKEEITIMPGETKILSTGIKVAIPEGYAILIQPRSGQSFKTKLRIANTPGLIDAGYRDDIGVIVENIDPPLKDIDYEFDNNGEIHIKSILHGEPHTIVKGQRFAQMRLVEVPTAAFFPVDDIGEIGEDRNGGFGSSGE